MILPPHTVSTDPASHLFSKRLILGSQRLQQQIKALSRKQRTELTARPFFACRFKTKEQADLGMTLSGTVLGNLPIKCGPARNPIVQVKSAVPPRPMIDTDALAQLKAAQVSPAAPHTALARCLGTRLSPPCPALTSSPPHAGAHSQQSRGQAGGFLDSLSRASHAASDVNGACASAQAPGTHPRAPSQPSARGQRPYASRSLRPGDRRDR